MGRRGVGGGAAIAGCALAFGLVACNALTGVGDLATSSECTTSDCNASEHPDGGGPNVGGEGGPGGGGSDGGPGGGSDGGGVDSSAPSKPGGFLDPSLGEGGIWISTDLDTLTAIAVRPDGKMVAGSNDDERTAVVLLTSGGAIDSSFAGDGVAGVSLGDSSHCSALAVDGLGRTVVAGQDGVRGAGPGGTTVTNDYALFARFDVDGAAAGAVRSKSTNDRANAVAIDGTNGAFLAGVSGNKGALWRITPTGDLDENFGGNDGLGDDHPGHALSAVAVTSAGVVVAAATVTPRSSRG